MNENHVPKIVMFIFLYVFKKTNPSDYIVLAGDLKLHNITQISKFCF